MNRKQRFAVISALIMTVFLMHAMMSSSETPGFAVSNSKEVSAADLLKLVNNDAKDDTQAAPETFKPTTADTKGFKDKGESVPAAGSAGSLGAGAGSGASSGSSSQSKAKANEESIEALTNDKDGADSGFSSGSPSQSKAKANEESIEALTNDKEDGDKKGYNAVKSGNSDYDKLEQEEDEDGLSDAKFNPKSDKPSSQLDKTEKPDKPAMLGSTVLDDEEDDPVASTGTFDAASEYKEILSMSPVVIFSKTYCPYSLALKELFSKNYEFTPQPAIVELDLHKNGPELQAYIAEQSGRRTVPNLIVNGVSRGGSDDMKALHSAGTLLEDLRSWAGSSVKVTKVPAPSNS